MIAILKRPLAPMQAPDAFATQTCTHWPSRKPSPSQLEPSVRMTSQPLSAGLTTVAPPIHSPSRVSWLIATPV